MMDYRFSCCICFKHCTKIETCVRRIDSPRRKLRGTIDPFIAHNNALRRIQKINLRTSTEAYIKTADQW